MAEWAAGILLQGAAIQGIHDATIQGQVARRVVNPAARAHGLRVALRDGEPVGQALLEVQEHALDVRLARE